MPVIYAKEEPTNEAPALDADELEEIQETAEQLADLIKAELINLKARKQTTRKDGAEVYHKLISVSREIRTACECIDTIRARA